MRFLRALFSRRGVPRGYVRLYRDGDKIMGKAHGRKPVVVVILLDG